MNRRFRMTMIGRKFGMIKARSIAEGQHEHKVAEAIRALMKARVIIIVGHQDFAVAQKAAIVNFEMVDKPVKSL